jgi:hypothetical protein
MTPSAITERGAAEEAVAGLGADLLAVVARLNRYATQRIQMQLPAAQARLLSTVKHASAIWPRSIIARSRR